MADPDNRQRDVIVIGAGPGGYVAAIRAAQLGLDVTVIEKEHLGGICLNWGCIPTKALLRSAEVFALARRGGEFGLTLNDVGFDLPAMVARSRKVARQLNQGVGHLLRKNGVELVMGTGRLLGDGKVGVRPQDGGAERVLSARRIILATGARARDLPGLEADGARVWNYRHALEPPFFPERLLVVGSGAIGIEFASFFNTLGSRVTVVEVMERILPVEDAEISDLARRAFERQGMTIRTGATVEALERGAREVVARIRQGESREEAAFDAVIMAVGITANIEGLGLADAGVEVDRGHVVVDEFCRTSAEGIHAIGDIAQPPWLAHKASHEGVMVAEYIAGRDVHPIRPERIPGCTYCTPQIASVGLTEEAARAAGHEIRIGRFPLIGNGKAIALGEPEGLVKTVFDARTGELLGAHMIGPEVTELVQGFAVGQSAEATEAEFIATVFPHPTLSESMHEAVLAAWEGAIHI